MRFDSLRNFAEFARLNMKLLVGLGVAVSGLMILQMYTSSGTLECMGIADSKETMISFEYPVVVKQVFVVPGQQIKKGQALIEVEPSEINLKYLEIKTELESLESERDVRDALLGAFTNKKSRGEKDPIGRSIAGLRLQLQELERVRSSSVRYATSEGIVASVSVKASEQIAPFLPAITLSTLQPTLVNGFIHENLASKFRVGDLVTVEPITDSSRKTKGRVISLGSRIAPFPERFQSIPNRPTSFGRELLVSLNGDNRILMGERVRIFDTGDNGLFSDLNSSAFAANTVQGGAIEKIKSEPMFELLPLEAGGLIWEESDGSVLLASDEVGPAGSAFWLLSTKDQQPPVNLPLKAEGKIDDIESLTKDGDYYYAMASLSPNKKGELKDKRNRLVRFTRLAATDVGAPQGAATLRADRTLLMREPMLKFLKGLPLLSVVRDRLDAELEIEAFSMRDGDAYFGLKQPQMPDGSSIVVRVRSFKAAVEASLKNPLDGEVFALLPISNDKCVERGRLSDVLKLEGGLLLLSNCRSKESVGKIWWLKDGESAEMIHPVADLSAGSPEGIALGDEPNSVFVSSDNGKKGSDIIKIYFSEPLP